MFNCALPFPPSTNRLFRNARASDNTRTRIKTQLYMAWIRAAEWDVARARGPAETMTGPVVVAMTLYAPDRRRRGLDNYQKAPLDLLVSCGVIENDEEQVRKITAEWGDKPGCKGCVVTVLEAS